MLIYLAPFRVNLRDCLDSVQMIDAWVQSNLVHDDDTCLLGLSVQFTHRRTDIAGGNDMRLSLDGRLDDSRMVSVCLDVDTVGGTY